MAESEVRRLQKELQFKKLQLNSIHELTSAMQAQFDVDHVMRIFFSSLMAPLGLSRAFFFDRRHELLRKRGFILSAGEILLLRKTLDRAVAGASCVNVDELPPALEELKKLLQARRIFYLLNIAENRKKPVVLGLGRKFNLRELAQEDFEFACILSHFMMVELENIRYLEQILEKKKLEHEMKIARGIQLSLLPQGLPQLQRYDMAVIYEPIQEVGGDYYDILKKRKSIQPLVLADVEGKGLAAALLAELPARAVLDLEYAVGEGTDDVAALQRHGLLLVGAVAAHAQQQAARVQLARAAGFDQPGSAVPGVHVGQ